MTLATPTRPGSVSERSRPGPVARRVGYAVSIAVCALLLFLVNAEPGWRVLPFLTEETVQVLGLLNLSLAASIAANAVYLYYDPPWLTAIGDFATTAVGLAMLLRVWTVFPFDLGDTADGWSGLLVRSTLVVVIAGVVIGMVVNLVRFAQDLIRRG